MASTTTGKGISTSFANTPQAQDDTYSLMEEQVLGLISTVDATHKNVLTLDVMSNDLGGNAKTLFSIDDGNGHTNLTDYDLLTADGNGVWEALTNGDSLRIYNGKIQYDITGSLTAVGATSVNSLAAGDHIHDEFVYAIRLANGTLSQAKVVLDIFGENDAASISGNHTGNLTEDSTSPATGTLTVIDPDHGQSHTTAASGMTAKGSWSVDGDGHWSYTVNNAAENHLAAGVHDSDSFTVTGLDGTASQQVTIDIVGVNDSASIAGDTGGGVAEDGTLTANGTLTVSDVDDGESHTQVVVAPAHNSDSQLGSYSVDAGGHWSYTVDNSLIQHLATNQHTNDSFTVTSLDGTASQQVTIDIVGTNDDASISGVFAGNITEDTTLTANGTLIVSDLDDGESRTQVVVAAAHNSGSQLGSYSVDSDGHWSYAVDNSLIQHLAANQHTSDSFTVTSLDGTASQMVTIDIVGVNDDAAFFAGGNSGSMTEDDSTTIGDISVNDLDGGESHTAAGGGTTALGSSWSIDAAGHWSYALNNAAVQNLNVNGSTTDSFIVSSFDGTASETVTITIAGLNDPATVTGNTSGTVTEAGAGNAGGTPTATGTLHDTDVDNNPNSFQAASGATTYGSFSILQNGKWTYTLDNTNAAFDGLITGQTLPDSFTVQTQDGTVQVVNITINGATDDLGGPTGIAFTMNAGANNANNLGTFTEIGDPDNTNDVYTGSVGSGSSVGFNVSGGTLNAGGVTVGANSILNLVLTDQAGHTATATYHVWIGGNGADNFSFAALGDNGSNIGDGMGNSDIITGGSGTDYLLGDNGGDTLIGGGAADFLAGGGGADTFKFTAVSDSTPASYDTVLDFNATGGQHDFIAFQNSLGLTTFDGQLGGATIAAGHVGWKVVGSETVVYANTSGATENLGSTNLEIHISGNGLGLTTADFLLHA